MKVEIPILKEENDRNMDNDPNDDASFDFKRKQKGGRKVLRILQSRWSVIDLRGALLVL